MDASPIRVPGRRSNIVQKSLDRGSDHKNTGGAAKKKNRTIYQLPQVSSISNAAANSANAVAALQ